MSRWLLSFVLLGFLGGCSTAQKPSSVGQLQIKMTKLERKLNENNQKVVRLQDKVDELTTLLEQYDSENDYLQDDFNEPVINPPKEAEKKSKKTKTKSSKGKVIRVSAKPKQIQLALKNAGYYAYSVDGKIGKRSVEAIKQFQKDHDLKADGIVGSKTWYELKYYLE